jgi:probable HAF family extracellular repeat protein
MRRRIVISVLVLVVSGHVALARPPESGRAASPAEFEAAVIPIPDGAQGVAVNAINAKSTAVGSVLTSDPSTGMIVTQPFLFGNGKLKLLGDGANGVAMDINNRGRIVGFVDVTGPGDSRPAMLTSGAATELGTLGGIGAANAINGAGQVVGYSATGHDPDATILAVVWEDGEVSDVGTLAEGGSSMAYDIDDDGRIVGGATLGAGQRVFAAGSHAVLWEDGEITDLGTLGDGELSIAVGINASGVIIGTSTTVAGEGYGGASMQAFVWQDGEMEALPAPEGFSTCIAASINRDGWITGVCGVGSVFGDTVGVLWLEGVPFVLNDLVPDGAWTITRAHGVSDSGQVVCTAIGADGTQQALILTPTDA